MPVFNLDLIDRPTTFGEIYGQDAAVRALELMVQTGDIPRAILLHGPRGCGKTTAATIFAKAVADSDWDIIVWDTPLRNKVEDIAELIDLARLAVPEGTRRVVILDEAHRITPPAFDKFLKTLEPAVQDQVLAIQDVMPTVFIFVTTEYDKIPETVRSRCVIFQFQALSDRAVRQRLDEVLTRHGQTLSAEAQQAIVGCAGGDMRQALQSTARVLQAGGDWQQTLLGGAADPVRQIVRALTQRNCDALRQALHAELSDPKAVAVGICSQIPLTGERFWSQVLRCLYLVSVAPTVPLAAAQLRIGLLHCMENTDAQAEAPAPDAGAGGSHEPSATDRPVRRRRRRE